jgi:hypothetical protein
MEGQTIQLPKEKGKKKKKKKGKKKKKAIAEKTLHRKLE